MWRAVTLPVVEKKCCPHVLFNFFKEFCTMKRFHVHLAVNDIAQSVGFYSTLFGHAPSVQKDDYAKWMLDDPRINFAISARGHAAGLDHLGFQVESAGELHDMTDTLQQAGVAVTDMGAATCCYAQGEKGWVHDPQGIAWESFVTTGASTTYGAGRAALPASASACCAPVDAKMATEPVAPHPSATLPLAKAIAITPASCDTSSAAAASCC
jgi:catechol 2,3-dioxygenase-like lactoylglutathione lyase family enzyme